MSGARGRTAKTRDVNDRTIRESHRSKHRDLDPQGLLSPGVIRQFIAAATCPYCGAGPFTSLSGHTNRAHGIDRHDLRVAAHIPESQPISSADFRERCRERGKRMGFGHGVDASAAGTTARAKGQGKQTEAGRERQRKNIEQVRESMTPEAYRKARLKAWETLKRQGRADEKLQQLQEGKRAKGLIK